MSGQIETKRDYTADVAVRDFIMMLHNAKTNCTSYALVFFTLNWELHIHNRKNILNFIPRTSQSL